MFVPLPNSIGGETVVKSCVCFSPYVCSCEKCGFSKNFANTKCLFPQPSIAHTSGVSPVGSSYTGCSTAKYTLHADKRYGDFQQGTSHSQGFTRHGNKCHFISASKIHQGSADFSLSKRVNIETQASNVNIAGPINSKSHLQYPCFPAGWRQGTVDESRDFNDTSSPSISPCQPCDKRVRREVDEFPRDHTQLMQHDEVAEDRGIKRKTLSPPQIGAARRFRSVTFSPESHARELAGDRNVDTETQVFPPLFARRSGFAARSQIGGDVSVASQPLCSARQGNGNGRYIGSLGNGDVIVFPEQAWNEQTTSAHSNHADDSFHSQSPREMFLSMENMQSEPVGFIHNKEGLQIAVHNQTAHVRQSGFYQSQRTGRRDSERGNTVSAAQGCHQRGVSRSEPFGFFTRGIFW